MKKTLYAKTPRAWEALSRQDRVSPQTHALLLLANGRRSLHELCVLLGEDVGERAYQLAAEGYLRVVIPSSPPPEEDAGPESGFFTSSA